MAIIIPGKIECPICKIIIQSAQEIVATSPFLEPNDSLSHYQDAAIHKECFIQWPLREEFIKKFNDFFYEHYRGMKYMHNDGSIEEREPRS